MVTGNEAIARALAVARIRRAWSFPGSPLTKLEMLLDGKGAAGVSHRFTVNEHVAASLALGGALLSGSGTCVLMKHVGVNVALDTWATFGLVNELRSPSLVVEGVDPGPVSSQNAQDNRAGLASVAHLMQLEAGAPDEAYQLTRLGALASQRTGMPVLVRVHERTLTHKADVGELPPELPEGSGVACFARAAGPYISTATTYRYHADKRARRLRQLQPFVEALAVKTIGESQRAVVIAGTLGPWAHARAWARRLSTVRLGTSWPLPRQALLELMKGRDELLVLEEGEPFLERELQAFAHREWLECRVRGVGDARPQRLDNERVELLLGRFGGRVRAEVDPVLRTANDWKLASDALAAIGDDDGEPWPLFVARVRPQMKAFTPADPRVTLLTSLRQLGRPTIIVADPGTTGVLGIRDRLVDVKMHMGSAAPIAGALADAAEVEEQAGAPLAAALIGDTNHYHSELLGVLDNAIAKREVLHVLVVNRRSEMTAGVKTPYLSDEALETQLRSAGLHVTTASLDDPALAATVSYAASRPGPRALICYGATRGEMADG